MNATLTLNVEQRVIEQAEMYAHAHRISLAKLIEIYLKTLTRAETKTTQQITPLVESLTGVISSENVDNYKNDYHDYLAKKYL
ncbi:hypothetical protein AGMMS49965_20810 [Bacteroidia bacterium]|nr:hypothetical protein AGMMS49965_20810 [Bacteroidia bacterium]